MRDVCLQYELVHISVVDVSLEKVAEGTAAGRSAQSFMDSGNLVPNEVLLSRRTAAKAQLHVVTTRS